MGREVSMRPRTCNPHVRNKGLLGFLLKLTSNSHKRSGKSRPGRMSNPYYVGLDPEQKREVFDYLYNSYAEPILEKIQEHCFSGLSEEIRNK
jgi:hypothetical protein